MSDPHPKPQSEAQPIDAKLTLKEQQAFFAELAGPFELLALFDHLPDVYLYIKDVAGRFMKVNLALARLRGFASEADLLGKTDLDIHPEHWGHRYIEEDRRVMAGGTAIPNQVWLVPASDGRLGWYISSKIPLRSGTGTVIGVAGVMYSFESAEEIVQPYRELESVCKFVEDNYDQSIQIPQLAKVAGLSVSQLARRFAALFQMSPSQYIRRVRIHQATRMLSETDFSVGQISLRCGFYDQAHFTRTFRKWMGQSPIEFRRSRGMTIAGQSE